MKKILIILFSSLPGLLWAQYRLEASLNLPRIGDAVIKQQVQYKDPGRPGENVIWDFGQLQSINEEYRLTYISPRLRHDTTYVLGRDTFLLPDGLIVGREHYTNYFYRLKDGIFSILGYENKLDLMHHIVPLPVAKFPMAYGDSLRRVTRSEGLFSGQVPLFTHGEFSLVADAYGALVLPSGDTLHQVLRTRSLQKILSDRVEAMDSIFVDTKIETYRWYARGYRYPVFETTKAIHKTDSKEEVFATAFFFPPPQDNFWEIPDSANIAEREKMLEEDLLIDLGNPWAGMTYNVFPNPVVNDLQFELYLPRPCNEVRIQIHDQMGLIFINENNGPYPQGIHTFRFNMSGLSAGNYVLDFWLDGYLVHGSVILKR